MTVVVLEHQQKETPTTLRSVELALQRENEQSWEFADAVFEDVLLSAEQDVATPSSDQSNTGLKAAEDKVYEGHQEAGTEVTRAALHNMFVTRRVWPPQERRPDLASFSVHYELRGKDFKNRRQIIEKLATKSTKGRVSLPTLRRWKSERKPPALKTFRELFEERVRRAAYQTGKPWHMVAEEDRYALARVMRDIALEIEEGSFGVSA